MPETINTYRNTITLDVSSAIESLNALKGEASIVQNILSNPIKVSADTSDATSKIGELKNLLSSIRSKTVKVKIDSSELINGVNQVKSLLTELASVPFSLKTKISVDNSEILNVISSMSKSVSEKKIEASVGVIADMNSAAATYNQIATYFSNARLVIPVEVSYVGGDIPSGGEEAFGRNAPRKTIEEIISESGLYMSESGRVYSYGKRGERRGNRPPASVRSELNRMLEEEGYSERYSIPKQLGDIELEGKVIKSRENLKIASKSLIKNLEKMSTSGEGSEIVDILSKIEPELAKIEKIASEDIRKVKEEINNSIRRQYIESIKQKGEEIASKPISRSARASKLHEIRNIKIAQRTRQPIASLTEDIKTEPLIAPPLILNEESPIPIGGIPIERMPIRSIGHPIREGINAASIYGLISKEKEVYPGWDITGKTGLSQEEFDYIKRWEEYKNPPTRGRRRIANMPGMQNIRKELDAMLGTTQKTEEQIAESIKRSITRLPILTREQSEEARQLLDLIPNNILANTKELRDIRLVETIKANATTKEQYQQILREHGRPIAALSLAGKVYATGAINRNKNILLARTVPKTFGVTGSPYPLGASDVTLFHEIAHALNIPMMTGESEQRPAIIEWLKNQGINVPGEISGKYRPLSIEEESARWVETQNKLRESSFLKKPYQIPYSVAEQRRMFPVPTGILLQQKRQAEIYRRMGLSQSILGTAAQMVGGHRAEGLAYPVEFQEPDLSNLLQYTSPIGKQGILSKITTAIYRSPLNKLMTAPSMMNQASLENMLKQLTGSVTAASLRPGLGGGIIRTGMDIFDSSKEMLLDIKKGKFSRGLAAGYRGFREELSASYERNMLSSQMAQANKIAGDITKRAYINFIENSVSKTVSEMLMGGSSFEKAKEIASKQVFDILYGNAGVQTTVQPSAQSIGVDDLLNLLLGGKQGEQTMFSIPKGQQGGGPSGLLMGLYANNANPVYGPGGAGLKGGPFTLGGTLRHAMFFAEGTMIYMILSGLMQTIKGFISDAAKEAEKWSGIAARIKFVTNLPEEATQYYMKSEVLRAYTYGIGPSEALEAQLIAARSRTGKYDEQRQLMRGAAQISVLSGEEMSSSMETLITLQKQYNISASETQKIVDVIAYAYRNSTDSIDSLTDALARAGSATKLMGLNLEESFAVISGISEVSTRTGTSIAAMLTQMSRVMYSTTGKSLLASVGIGVTEGGKERSSWDVITQAAQVWQTNISDAQRRAIATGIGGPRYSSDVAAFLENFDEINRSRVAASREAGGSMENLMKALKDDVGYQYRRSKAAYQMYVEQPGAGINVWRRFYDQWIERYYSARTYEIQLNQSEELRKQLGLRETTKIQKSANLVGLGRRDYLAELYKSVGKETSLSGVELDREVGLRIAEAQDRMANLPSGTTAKARGLTEAEPFRTLDMLSTTKMTGAEADQLTEAVLRWQEKLEQQGFSQENQVEKNILVQRGIEQKIESIVGTAEAIELATAEIAENTKMRGVWNIPTGWVPIESIFSGMQQSKLNVGEELFKTVSSEESYTEKIINRKPQEQIKMIKEGDFEVQNKKAIELPMIMKEGTNSESTAKKLSDALKNNSRNLLSYNPFITTGSTEVVKSTKETAMQQQIVINVPVMLDGEKIGNAVAIVNGNELLRNIRSGGNYGSHNASVVGGVI